MADKATKDAAMKFIQDVGKYIAPPNPETEAFKAVKKDLDEGMAKIETQMMAESDNLKWMTDFFKYNYTTSPQVWNPDVDKIVKVLQQDEAKIAAKNKPVKPTREVKSIRELYNYGPDEVRVAAKPAKSINKPLEGTPASLMLWMMWQGIPVTKTIFDALEVGPEKWGNHGKFSNHPNCTCVWEAQQYAETTNLHFTAKWDETAPIMKPQQYIYTWKWAHYPCQKHIGLNNL